MPAAPEGNQVLVRMIHAPINPADLLAIDGRYAFALDAGVPLGAEGVGCVEAVGENVSDLAPGDRVLPLTRGNWCRFRAVMRAELIVLPQEIDVRQAAMLRINPLTARLLIDAACVLPGDILLQNAASSLVASWVRVLARARDVTVIDIVRRADPALPDAIVDGKDLVDRIRESAAGRPVRAALDCVAGAATGRMAQSLSPAGRIIVFGHLSGDPVSVPSQLLTGGGLIVSGFSLRPAEAAFGTQALQMMLAELIDLGAQAGLVAPVRAVLPLSRPDAALACAREAGRGRVLFDLTA